jgi:hypothetical protein
MTITQEYSNNYNNNSSEDKPVQVDEELDRVEDYDSDDDMEGEAVFVKEDDYYDEKEEDKEDEAEEEEGEEEEEKEVREGETKLPPSLTFYFNLADAIETILSPKGYGTPVGSGTILTSCPGA